MEILQNLIIIAASWLAVSVVAAAAFGRWLALQDQRASRAHARHVALDAYPSVAGAAPSSMRETDCSAPRRSRRVKLIQRPDTVRHH